MSIQLKRVYDEVAQDDGHRVLVDRVWPRGIGKGEAGIDVWLKQIAPSASLRKWFHKDPCRWGGFRRRYLSELKEHRALLRSLARRARKERVTLVFGSRDREHNNAVVVKQYMHMLNTGSR